MPMRVGVCNGRARTVTSKALAFDFTAGAMPGGLTFARASAATLFNAAGSLDWCPMNLLINSAGVGGGVGVTPTGWGVANGATGVTVTVTGVGTDSDGTPYLDARWSGTNTSGSTTFPAMILQLGSTGPVSGVGARLSGQLEVRLIAGTAPQMTMYLQGTTSGNSFIESGSANANITPTSTNTAVTVVNTVHSNVSTTRANMVFQRSMLNNESIDFTLRLRKAQMNYGATLQPYAATYGTAYYGPRLDYDPFTHSALGLLMEEVRTNLLTNSRTVTGSGTTCVPNQAAGIDGVAAVATLVTAGGGSVANFGTYPQVTFTSGVTYSFTIAVKAGTASIAQITTTANAFPATAYFNVDLTTGAVLSIGAGVVGTPLVRKLPTGYWLCSFASTANVSAAGAGTAVAFLNTGTDTRGPSIAAAGATLIVDHGQCEVGSIASSIIPTWGATATRATESCTAPTMLPMVESTLYVEFMQPAVPPPNNQSAFAFARCDASNQYGLVSAFGDPTQHRMDVIVGGTTTSSASLLNATSGTIYKFAGRHKSGDQRVCQNGVLAGSGLTLATNTPSTSALFIGHNNGGQCAKGYIRKVAYYPRAYSDSELQALTT